MNSIYPGHILAEQTPNERFQDALRAFQDLDVQRAYDLVQCAIRQDPNQVDYYLFKAKLFETSGSDRRATIQSYETALNLQPMNAETMLRLAQHLQAEGMQVRALTLIQRARELSPNHKLLKRMDITSTSTSKVMDMGPEPVESKGLKNLGQQTKTLLIKILERVVGVRGREGVPTR